MDNAPQAGRNASVTDYLKAFPQYLLPHHPLSRIVHAATRWRFTPWKNTLIRWVSHHFDIDMSEVAEPDPYTYPSFNHFFTRALRSDARNYELTSQQLCCPVDGTVSQLGAIADGRIFQAKGRSYSVEELLGGSAERAAPFMGGRFTTLYLSPRDYHRIHIPVSGTLREMVHVPGRLFSVNPPTTRTIPRLFARNERVVTLFDTEAGPMAVVMVGALFVGSIETVWAGEVTPPHGREVRVWDYRAESGAPHFTRGEEIGRFNMGSTVILLFGPSCVNWAETLAPECPVRFGQPLAEIAGR